MANLLTLLRRKPEISRLSQQDVLDLFAQQPYLGYSTSVYTTGGRKTEKIPNSYAAYAETAYCSSSVVGAVMRVRRDIFRQARFTWREQTEDGTGVLMHDDALAVLERPWPNGTTGELLVKMITDVDLCGNSFIVNEGERLRWRRPDWMYLVLSGDPEVDVDVDVIGYVYTPGGCDIRQGTPYLPENVCHWSPIPAWGAQYIGQSWMVSALKDIQADKAATDHKLAFFTNGATLGPIFVLPPSMTPEQFKKFREANDEAHVGADNAYKPLYIGGGATVTMSASTFQQLELKATQGAGETRIAALAGVHPAIVGLSEGLGGSSLNAGNFTAARRITSDITMMPLWQDVCSALSTFVEIPDGYELWIRESAIPFLREDAKDAADIASVNAQMITSLVREGYEPESAQRYAITRNPTDLKHSGLMSVQLQPPGSEQVAEEESGGFYFDEGQPQDLTTLRSELFRDARFESLHKRGRGGRFVKMVDRIFEALTQWADAGMDDDSDPLEGFKREHLREALKARGITPKRGGTEGDFKAQLRQDVRDVVGGKKTAPTPVKKAAKKAAPEAVPRGVEIENDIRAAFRDLVGRTDLPKPDGANNLHDAFREEGWVSLADIRDALGEKFNRTEVDAALRRMVTGDDPSARVIPQAARHGLMQRDHDAALKGFGDADQHWLKIADPSPRAAKPDEKPTPKKATFDAADVAEQVAAQSSEEDVIGLLSADPTLTAAKLRKVADELDIDIPENKRAKTSILLHIAEHAPRGDAKPNPDGLDGMDEAKLRSYAQEWDIPKAREKSAAQLRKELREKGIGSPAVEQAKRRAEAGPEPSRESLSQDEPTRRVQIQNRIRAAYSDLLREQGKRPPDEYGGGWVNLADLRDRLADDLSRDELDTHLVTLARVKGVQIVPESNQKTLTQRQRDASIMIGNQDRHLISILDPTPKTAEQYRDMGFPVEGPPHPSRARPKVDVHGDLTPTKKAPPRDLPSGGDIETVGSVKELTLTQIARGEHLTPAGRRALDALGPEGHPRIAAIPDTEQKIREAYRMLAVPGTGFDHYVAFTDLRKLIGEQVPRAEVDDTLRRMMRMQGVHISPQSYARENYETRKPAALILGGQENDAIWIEDPSLARPRQFGAVAIAEELANRRSGGPRDPMMSLLSDAELQAEVDRRAAADPVVTHDLATLLPAKAAKKAVPKATPTDTSIHRQLDAREIAKGLGSEADFKHGTGSYLDDVQKKLDDGKTPGQVAREVEVSAQTLENSTAIRYGGSGQSAFVVDDPDYRAQQQRLYDEGMAKVRRLRELAERLRATRRTREGAPAQKAAPAAPEPTDLTSIRAHRTAGRDLAGTLDYEGLWAIPYVQGEGDSSLAEIWRQQGFDGPPRMVSRTEWDRLKAQGGRPIYRGVRGRVGGISAAEMVDRYTSGDHYPGVGVFGNGSYFTDSAKTAGRYSTSEAYGPLAFNVGAEAFEGSAVIEAMLLPDARVVDFHDLQRQGKALGVPDGFTGVTDPRSLVLGDPGRLAAALGYDAIVIRTGEGTGDYGNEVLVLNRTATAVRGPDGARDVSSPGRDSGPAPSLDAGAPQGGRGGPAGARLGPPSGRRQGAAGRDRAPTQVGAEPTDLASIRALSDPESMRDALDLRKVDDLKALLRQEQLPVSGRKRELVDRLVEHLSGSKPSPAKAAKAAVPKAGGRAPAAPVVARDLFDADDATVTTALRDVFEGQFGPYTTKVQVRVTRAGTRVDKRGREHKVEPSISVDGKIYDADGTEIGYFGRTISPVEVHYPDGTVRREVWADHKIVQLGGGDYDTDPARYHGTGFGGEFNRRAIEWYRASGVHGISQTDENGYVWASQGFNFSRGGTVPDYLADNIRTLISDLRAGRTTSEATKDEYRTLPKQIRDAPDLDAQIAAAEELLTRASGKPGDPGYPTAYEISQLGRRQGQRGKGEVWLGKLLFVSADEMILNPDSGEVVEK